MSNTTTEKTGMLIGYARVSTNGQDLSIQENALRAAGCTIIRAEKKSGTRREGRTELETLLQYLRAGDTVVITRIDRLARSLRDLQNIVHEIKDRGAFLRATEQAVDTSTPAGKAFLDMLGVFAEFETNLRADRQREGIEQARENGVYVRRRTARPAMAKAASVLALLKQEIPIVDIARTLGINRSSVYRILRLPENAEAVTREVS